jgi:hypothetical protein
MPHAAATHAGEAPVIAERTPARPGTSARIPITTATRTPSRIAPRMILRLRSAVSGGACCTASTGADVIAADEWSSR